MNQRQIEQALPRFEGLVFETARLVVQDGVEIDVDDVRQLLRMKVWRTLERYDASRDTRLNSLERFVFGCLLNFRKDLTKRPRRYNASIDALRERQADGEHTGVADRFDARYLSVDAEQVFAEVEEDGEPSLPPDLTVVERQVIALKLQGRMLLEIDRELGLSRAQRERVMRSVREKLGAWCPNAPAQRTAPMSPLPHAEPRQAPVRAALAA